MLSMPSLACLCPMRPSGRLQSAVQLRASASSFVLCVPVTASLYWDARARQGMYACQGISPHLPPLLVSAMCILCACSGACGCQ